MTSAGTGVSRVCDSCNFLDDKMSFLREETKKRGFTTVDGVHMGPCEIHRQHAHTIGPDGSLFACPGFAGEALQSTGHIDGRQDDRQAAAAHAASSASPRGSSATTARSFRSAPAAARVAAHNELGDMNTRRTATSAVSKRASCRSRASRRARRIHCQLSGSTSVQGEKP